MAKILVKTNQASTRLEASTKLSERMWSFYSDEGNLLFIKENPSAGDDGLYDFLSKQYLGNVTNDAASLIAIDWSGNAANVNDAIEEVKTSVNNLNISSLTPKGIWVTGTAYNYNDYVVVGGSSYVAYNDIPNSTLSPEIDGANWYLLVQGFDPNQLYTIGYSVQQGLSSSFSILNSGSNVIFDSVVKDVNGDYDVLSGVYTAPVNGDFLFNVSAFVLASLSTGSVDGDVQVTLLLRDTATSTPIANAYTLLRFTEVGSNVLSDTLNINQVVSLTQGQEVELFIAWSSVAAVTVSTINIPGDERTRLSVMLPVGSGSSGAGIEYTDLGSYSFSSGDEAAFGIGSAVGSFQEGTDLLFKIRIEDPSTPTLFDEGTVQVQSDILGIYPTDNKSYVLSWSSGFNGSGIEYGDDWTVIGGGSGADCWVGLKFTRAAGPSSYNIKVGFLTPALSQPAWDSVVVAPTAWAVHPFPIFSIDRNNLFDKVGTNQLNPIDGVSRYQKWSSEAIGLTTDAHLSDAIADDDILDIKLGFSSASGGVYATATSVLNTATVSKNFRNGEVSLASAGALNLSTKQKFRGDSDSSLVLADAAYTSTGSDLYVKTLTLTQPTTWTGSGTLYYEKIILNGHTLTGNVVQDFWDNTNNAVESTFEDKGAWLVATAYVLGDIAVYDGYRWISKTIHTGTTPTNGSADWSRIDEQPTMDTFFVARDKAELVAALGYISLEKVVLYTGSGFDLGSPSATETIDVYGDSRIIHSGFQIDIKGNVIFDASPFGSSSLSTNRILWDGITIFDATTGPWTVTNEVSSKAVQHWFGRLRIKTLGYSEVSWASVVGTDPLRYEQMDISQTGSSVPWTNFVQNMWNSPDYVTVTSDDNSVAITETVINGGADESTIRKIDLSVTGGGSASPLSNKGELYTYDTADAALPVGTDGQILAADSNEATGLKWIGNNTIGTKVLVEGQMDTQQSFASNTDERIDYVDSTLDLNGEWDNTTHRFTVASSGAGVYQFTNSLFLNNGTGWSELSIRKNGVDVDYQYASDFANTWDAPNGSINIELVVGDYVEFWYTSNSNGGTINSTYYTNNVFQISKIGDSVTISTGVDSLTGGRDISLSGTATDPVIDHQTTSVIQITATTLNPNSDTESMTCINDLATTCSITAPTYALGGANGRKFIYRFRSSAIRILAWNGIGATGGFSAMGVTIPTATKANKTLYVGCIFNGYTQIWDVVSVAEES